MHVTNSEFLRNFKHVHLSNLSNAVQTSFTCDSWCFKIQQDKDKDAHAIRMCDEVSMYDLTQHVTVTTHISGHTLHLVIIRFRGLVECFCLVIL